MQVAAAVKGVQGRNNGGRGFFCCGIRPPHQFLSTAYQLVQFMARNTWFGCGRFVFVPYWLLYVYIHVMPVRSRCSFGFRLNVQRLCLNGGRITLNRYLSAYTLTFLILEIVQEFRRNIDIINKNL